MAHVSEASGSGTKVILRRPGHLKLDECIADYLEANPLLKRVIILKVAQDVQDSEIAKSLNRAKPRQRSFQRFGIAATAGLLTTAANGYFRGVAQMSELPGMDMLDRGVTATLLLATAGLGYQVWKNGNKMSYHYRTAKDRASLSLDFYAINRTQTLVDVIAKFKQCFPDVAGNIKAYVDENNALLKLQVRKGVSIDLASEMD